LTIATADVWLPLSAIRAATLVFIVFIFCYSAFRFNDTQGGGM
jgi:hypothetical protein